MDQMKALDEKRRVEREKEKLMQQQQLTLPPTDESGNSMLHRYPTTSDSTKSHDYMTGGLIVTTIHPLSRRVFLTHILNTPSQYTLSLHIRFLVRDE